MPYTFANLGCPQKPLSNIGFVAAGGGIAPGSGMTGSGHWAMPAGVPMYTSNLITGPDIATRYRGHGLTTPGTYAFEGTDESDGTERQLLLLLLFAAYANLLLNLLSPRAKVSEATAQP